MSWLQELRGSGGGCCGCRARAQRLDARKAGVPKVGRPVARAAALGRAVTWRARSRFALIARSMHCLPAVYDHGNHPCGYMLYPALS